MNFSYFSCTIKSRKIALYYINVKKRHLQSFFEKNNTKFPTFYPNHILYRWSFEIEIYIILIASCISIHKRLKFDIRRSIVTDYSNVEILTKEERKFIDNLLKNNKDSLIRAASKLLQTTDVNDISDCLQEVSLCAIMNGKELVSHPSPIGWLHKTLFNIAHDMKREADKRRTKLQSIDEVEYLVTDESFESDQLEKMDRQEIDIHQQKATILDKLTIRELDLYQLRYVEKREFSYIAEKYHTTPGCIRAWISQLKKKVKNLIRKL